MPRYDGTGPDGQGSGTGGGYGPCQNEEALQDHPLQRGRGYWGRARQFLGRLYKARSQTSSQDLPAGGLEEKSEAAPAAGTVESKVGTGLGPCGDGLPRGGGRGYHGGRK